MFESVKNLVRRMLVRSQSYTGTDNIYVARGSFWLSLGFAFNTLLSLGIVIAFANFVPKEAYGTYKYIISIAGTFSFLTLTGMNAAVTQMVAKGHTGALPYSIRIQLRWNLLYLVAGIVIAIYYALNANWLLAGGIGILALTLPFSAALNTYGAFLSGQRDFRRVTMYGTISDLFRSLTVLAAILLWPSVLMLIAAYALGVLLPTVWFCLRILRTVPREIAPEDAIELKRYAGHLSIMNVLATVDGYLDKILLFQNIGAVQLAIYSIALAMPERIRGFMKNLGNMLVPRLAERTLSDIRRSYYLRVSQGLLIGASVAAAYWIVTPVLFEYFLPQYTEAIPFSRMLGLISVFSIPTLYMGGVFRAHQMVRALYLSSIGSHGLRIILYIILTPLYGIWGLVWASLGTHVLGIVYNAILWELESRRLRLVHDHN